MTKTLRVLMVEDSEADALLMIGELKKGGYDPECERVETAETMHTALREKIWDVILCDYRLPHFNGVAAIALLEETNIDIPLIIVSGTIGEETAVECMRLGARDYIMKDNLPRLASAIKRELKEAKSRRQRKRAEEELKNESNMRMALLDNIPDCMALIIKKGTHEIVACNKFAREIGAIPGQTCFKTCGMRDDTCPFCLAPELLKTDQIQRLEVEYRGKWYEGIWAPLSEDLYVHYIYDITERKRAEAESKESKALIEAVVENVPLMIFLKEAKDLRFIIFNRAGEELLGYDRRDLMGKNNLDLFPPEQAAHFMAKDREVLDAEIGMLDIPEESILTARKGERLLHTRKVCIKGSDGVTKFLLGISEDITERKRAEEELRQTLESLRRAVNTTIQVMVSAVEVRDPYTSGHQLRSADLARAIATELGLSREKIEGIRMAGSIHDIGKLSIPAEILSKPTKLTEIELSLIKEHARKGYEMLKDVESPWPLAEIVYQHHERMDGSGYPRSLKGDEILIEARILSVADVVEAMASHRPYRAGLGINAALNEIEKNKGIFYDNTVADACLRLFREKGFQLAEA